jgi:DNA phosphorothioation-dependent restriction protein DptG
MHHRHDIPTYGHKAAQYVDLIGYCLIKSIGNAKIVDKYLPMIQDLYFKSNGLLRTHPNGFIYKSISSVIEFDGFYLGKQVSLCSLSCVFTYLYNAWHCPLSML